MRWPATRSVTSRIAVIAISPWSVSMLERDLGGELGAVPAQSEQGHSRSHRPGAGVVEVGSAVLIVHGTEPSRHQQLHLLSDQLLARVAE
jgi:hypothetical protein